MKPVSCGDPNCPICGRHPREDPAICRVCHLLGATDGICSICEKAANAPEPLPPGRLEGERIAFREWQVGEDLGLYSTGVGERWEREMVADSSRCSLPRSPFDDDPDKTHGHERSPDPSCPRCGLHAFYSPGGGTLRYARDDAGLVGAVVVSGRTMLGPVGVRAEKARVVLLAYANDRQKALADAASRKLGVGCCALEDLERLALEYGQPVPDDEKPEGAEGEFFTFGPARAIIGNNFVGPAAVTLSGGGSAAIKNLSVGVPSGRAVEVDGLSGEVAVRVDGQEWKPDSKGWPTPSTAFFMASQAAANAGLAATGLLGHPDVGYSLGGAWLVCAIVTALWLVVANWREKAS